MSVLEASYIVKLVYPYYKNFNKRIIKSPKLYFFDTGIVCSLLGIRTAEELSLHPIRGALFETFVMSELFKYNYNHNETPYIYFWRDMRGHEIDVIIEKRFDVTVPVEIKGRRTITPDFFKEVSQWQSITDNADTTSYLVYAGEQTMQRITSHGICMA